MAPVSLTVGENGSPVRAPHLSDLERDATRLALLHTRRHRRCAYCGQRATLVRRGVKTCAEHYALVDADPNYEGAA